MSKDLSIIIPSINPDRWIGICKGVASSVSNSLSYEIIFVGPRSNETAIDNVTFIEDFGCPSRALQIGAESSVGEIICWLPDDVILDERALLKCVELLRTKSDNDGITLRYDEGPNHQSDDASYWVAWTHTDLRCAGVDKEWKIAPVFMYKRKHFVDVGGIDCALEHVNMNAHSLAFYTQGMGGTIHPSPTRVFTCGWEHPAQDNPIFRAYHENDLPRFQVLWSLPDAVSRYKVPFDNWKSIPTIWPRRKRN